VEPIQLHIVCGFGHRCGCWSHRYILLLAVPEQRWLRSGLVGQHDLSKHPGQPGSGRVCNASTLWFDYGAHPFLVAKTLTEPYHSGPNSAMGFLKTPAHPVFFPQPCAAIIVSIFIIAMLSPRNLAYVLPQSHRPRHLRPLLNQGLVPLDCTTTHQFHPFFRMLEDPL